jgi:predicted HTH transcriptional regulator
VLNPTGSDRNSYIASIRQTACSLANSGGGFILFGVKDRRTPVTAPEERITGIPIGGDLLKEFGNKIEAVQPEIYFEAVPQVRPLPTDLSTGVFVVSIPQNQRRPHMDLSNGVYYKRGEGGSAVAMSHYEVREQMMNTEDRKQKVNLLRLELAQYNEIAMEKIFGPWGT